MYRRRTPLAVLCAAGLTGLFAGPALAATPQAAPAATTVRTSTVVLRDNVLPGLTHVPQLGAPSPSTTVQLTVALAHPDAAGETSLLRAMYTPGNPDYHHFLTPATYAARFGVAPASYDRVLAGITGHGLSVVYSAPTRTLVQLQGSLAAAAATFHVKFMDFRAPNGSVFYANTDAPTVPAGVQRVLGLESLSGFAIPRTAQTLCTPASVCVGAVTPQDLWGVYDQPSSDTGQGQKVAVIGAGDYTQPVKDLRQFEKEMGLPKVNVVEHNVADDLTYTSGEGEWALDSEASTGMAPGVQEIDYYFAEALGDADAWAAWVNDPNGPLQANASFGGCEALELETGAPAVDDPLFLQADLEGRTQFVSTGDTGGSCTVLAGNGFLNTVAPQVEYPASSPYVLAVGGTTLYTTGGSPDQRVLEKGWEYSGGGTSLMEPRQSWQTGVGATMVGECLTDNQGNPVTQGVPCRGLPDVAAMSGDITVLTAEAGRSYAGNGYQDVEGGSNIADGGTSLASPLWMGMWTRIQAAAPAVNGAYPGLGFADPALYNLAYNQTADDADFYNIAIGTNGQWHDMPRSAVDPTGWSYVSGLGVPVVGKLMETLDGSQQPADTALGAPTGTVTTVNGAVATACPPNGVVTNSAPAGEVNGIGPNDPSLDMTQVVTTFDPARDTLTWTATVQNLSANPEVGKAFAFEFTDAGKSFQLLAQSDPTNGAQYELDALSAPGTAETVSGEPTITKLVSLTGSFDPTTNTVSTILPLSTFNSASGAAALAAGSELTDLTDQSFDSEAGQAVTSEETLGYNLEISDPCAYYLTVAPGSMVPEAPFTALLVLAGLLAVGGAVYFQRRRRVATR
jgi:pseudomonalisin